MGVDEYATRKGRAYGTVLVDAETRRPVDLLPDREASSLAAWLAERPGVEIICRDRAPFFAESATAGARGPSKSRTAGTCGTTSAKRPSGPSPATDSAYSQQLPGRVETLLPTSCSSRRMRTSPGRQASGERTAPGPDMRRCTRCWPRATAGARSNGSSAWPIARSRPWLTPQTRESFSGASGRTGLPCSTSTSPTSTTAGTRAAPTPGSSGRRSSRSATRAAISASVPICGRSGPRRDP
ncbi:transposase [Kitasatospora sp. NPDC001540]|uniref:transposase n=1 Tax=Kitasatospora sp. NPDC001540 TaxID=3364014 RepID=UPI0036A5DEF9